ncbi:MAG TPA: DUF3298 domain-containing protein [Blastocatellia bacterium]|nr:DUF3298 domain-containing protein [Blastocatellia bacterium]
MARTLAWGLISLICLCGLQACRQDPQDKTADKPAARALAGGVAGGRDLGDGLQLLTREQRTELQNSKVTIRTARPELVGGDEGVTQAFNQAMRAFEAEQLRVFKSDYGANLREGSMELGYRILHADHRLISLQFNTSTYTGGAHPNNTSRAFTFDLQRRAMLNLADLFVANTDYLQTMADYCVQAIKDRGISDDDQIADGAGARPENYEQHWNVGPEGLLITFDAYQVAAYAVGPQEVRIPYAALKEILNPDGPLSAWSK